MILERDIGQELRAEYVVIARRPGRADGCLDVEIAPALSGGDRRRDIIGFICKWRDADRRLSGEIGTDNIIAVLCVTGSQPRFDEKKRQVGEASAGCLIVRT